MEENLVAKAYQVWRSGLRRDGRGIGEGQFSGSDHGVWR